MSLQLRHRVPGRRSRPDSPTGGMRHDAYLRTADRSSEGDLVAAAAVEGPVDRVGERSHVLPPLGWTWSSPTSMVMGVARRSSSGP
jgi:hypothetical protein